MSLSFTPRAHETPSAADEPEMLHMALVGTHITALKDEDRIARLEGGDMSFYLVADGHGGASVAELAAQRLLPDIAASEEPLEQAMRAAFLRLHAEALQPEHKSGGSTATVVALDRRNRQVTCVNVGDSLAYLVLSGADGRPVVTPLAVDHRLQNNEAERARVIASGGHVSQAVHPATGGPGGPLRGWPGGLAVSRSLGDAAATLPTCGT